MLKKLTLFLFLFLLASSLIAQNSRYVMKAGGDLIKIDANSDVKAAIKNAKLTDGSGKAIQSVFAQPVITGNGILDTLSYFDGDPDSYTSRFGFTGQDVMMTWYVAPAELVIKAIGFKAAADDVAGDQVSVRLLKFDWTVDQLMGTGVTRMGYYPSDGDGFGNQSAFPEEATGDWVDLTDGEYPTPPWDNPDYDLWSDFGFGWPVQPVGVASEDPNYQWVETAPLGEPHLQQGEIFAIAITHDGTTLDDERIGFWTMDGNATGIYSWKFYENGRNTAGGAGVGDGGWWAREYTFDFVAAVDLVGDRAPVISHSPLFTTLSNDARTVEATITDDNPSGGAAGVASATLMYSVDGGEFTEIAMVDQGGDVFLGEIPGQSAGTEVTYKINAVDVEGNETNSIEYSYSIFARTGNILLVYNDNSFGLGTIRAYWATYIPDSTDIWDVPNWGSAEVEAAMALYDNVVQIDGAYPAADLTDAAAAFMAASTAENPKHFFWSSQDYGCYVSGCDDVAFEAGSFMYDYMGVAGLVNQDFGADKTYMVPVEGEPQAEWLTHIADSLGLTPTYEPNGPLGFTAYMDEITPTDDATVFMMANNGTADVPVGVQLEGTNFKSTFIAYDYQALTLRSDTSLAYGDDPDAYWTWNYYDQVGAFFDWVDYVVGVVRNDSELPREYALSQNYPNPFNPSTVIKYSLVDNAKVSLKVYDILGKEVATLIDQNQAPGTYEFDFNASNLASGMYIYTLRAGDFVSSKKMMLLK